MIYIEPLHLKWEPGKILLKDHPKSEIKAFESFMAEEYVALVKKRVKEQKFAYKWSPLSESYLQIKKQNHWSLKTWEATGQLMKELKVKSNNVVGFDKRKRHKVSGQPLLEIARQNEYGSFKVPARPLFRLVYWYMSKHIAEYYKKFWEGIR